MAKVDPHERLLEEQIRYYRERAPEYDEWYARRGRYDLGAEGNRRWADELDQVQGALLASRPGGRVLEIAAGTGYWTRILASRAETLTALDSSPEALARNRTRVGDPRVRYEIGDVFSWQPAERYDFVFFAFWVSHVPAPRMARFWQRVGAALAPGGRVFLVDNLRSSSIRHPENPTAEDPTVERTLNDGRRFRIVKVYYTAAALAAELAALGWRPELVETERYFVLGSVEPSG
ncbi:MAG: SAM-dependent methyltransferase [Deltaproteobacteria bacterium]|jgi:demethylmenaquinone methyltransferase/2-methoxy-6-polyprenyl-1,4-benzoquinol methylase|nr:SAM-dependent methyltransferase [Deltaproteobacteria bacterium]